MIFGLFRKKKTAKTPENQPVEIEKTLSPENSVADEQQPESVDIPDTTAFRQPENLMAGDCHAVLGVATNATHSRNSVFVSDK